MRADLPPVAITGIGSVLPSGAGVAPHWQQWCEDTPALGAFGHALFRTQRITVYGGIAAGLRRDALESVPFKLRRYSTEPSQWAVHAAGQAIADAALDWDSVAEDRRGLFSGQGDYTQPDIGSVRAAVLAARQPGGNIDYNALGRLALSRRGADPFISIKGLANNALALVSLTFRCRGVGAAYVQNEAAGIAALRRAVFELSHGHCDIALVVACGSYAEPFTLAELWGRGLLGQDGAIPDRLAAFDQKASGTVLGEGAVALLLERPADARARGARTHALVHGAKSYAARINRLENHTDHGAELGYRSVARHLPTLEGPVAVMADGRGHPALDRFEAGQIQAAVPEAVPVSSARAITGVVPAAGALADLALATQVLANDQLPAIPGLDQPVLAGPDWVRATPRTGRFEHVLCLQQGFSGFFSAVTVSRAA
ncbi:beta-ketoacyl synthase N-terminal-like domain-containing protein [Tahibacter amnicola]|uniref:Ketosynthase family 3 (KS3) domain-containing protein n=1 Tax=Tahibacter amnicola TaxID=2976241 RepID=A0ABY6BGY1_9GAMM|nr:beta-ketoacyl synthase N-terminal-like domain-containing protein [Tahibacter amnicola]UXI69105.1 hypothetical protein N4264_05495 [Tahibacter amnicola]